MSAWVEELGGNRFIFLVNQFVFDYLIVLRARVTIWSKYFNIDLSFYERN